MPGQLWGKIPFTLRPAIRVKRSLSPDTSHLNLYIDSDICPALLLGHHWCQVPMSELSFETGLGVI